jgi:co-chaperonin GroES (HSP10)
MLKPTGDYLILKPLDKESVTASGIIIPETADK